MAVKERIKALVHHKRGDAAVEFICTAAMLILIFAVLVSAMIYVTQYYNITTQATFAAERSELLRFRANTTSKVFLLSQMSSAGII